MSPAAFRDLCGNSLSAADQVLLERLDPAYGISKAGPAYAEPPSPSSSDFINRWLAWERSLRLHLARFRAQRLKRDGGAPVDPPEDPMDAAAVAKAAVVIDSPLEAELFLDKSRWGAIEAFQGLDYFSSNTIFAYLLKLFLMERRSVFTAEEGFAEYKTLYSSIMERGESGEPK
jgi:hypothetical protein